MSDKYSSTAKARPADDPNTPLEKTLTSQPGGEAMAMREAKYGTDADIDGAEDETAAETPETTRKLSDATIPEGVNPYAPVGSKDRK